MNQFFPWFHHYGSIVVFLWLGLGLIALPIPEESVLIFLGVWIANGKLPLFPTIFAVYAGTCCGITGSYGLGLATNFCVNRRWSCYVGLTEKRFVIARHWFERIGKWALLIGYFIPGIRHLTGYVAGAVKLHYRQFSLYAYSGGLIWSSLFLTLGYVFSNRWYAIAAMLHSHAMSIFW